MLIEAPAPMIPIQESTDAAQVQYPLQWALEKAAFDGDEKLVNLLIYTTAIKNNSLALKSAVLEAETAGAHKTGKKVHYEAIIYKLQELIGP